MSLTNPPLAIVGGGSAGIGKASGRALAIAGHRVVLVGRTLASLQAAANDIAEETGAEVGIIEHDLSRIDEAPGFVAEVASRFGEPDVVVLNAGGPPAGRILTLDDAAWRSSFDLLLLGPVRLASLLLPGMAERGFGRVVVVTSTAIRQPEPVLAASVVLRSAMTAAAKMLSLEFAAQGVTVNCVAPGSTATDRRAQIVNGTVLTVDGGRTVTI